MIVVILFGMFLAMALTLVIARFAPNPRAVQLSLREPADTRPRVSSALLRSTTLELLDALGLVVVEEELVGDERRLIAANAREPALAQSRYVVFVDPRPPGDVVPQETTLELSEYVKSERAALGMLITPYTIEREGLGSMEVPLELVDGSRLAELLARYLPARAEELRHYRGIGEIPTSPTAPLPTPR
jgi:hypothetical protein